MAVVWLPPPTQSPRRVLPLWLMVLRPRLLSGVVPAVRETPFVIGQLPDCHLRLTMLGIAGRHCQLDACAGRLFVCDLASGAHTVLNGRRVTTAAEMDDGDFLAVGPLALQIRLHAGCAAQKEIARADDSWWSSGATP